jgi:hypothetical protein
MITLGSTTDMTAFAGTFMTDLWPVVALAVGVPLSFYIIKKVIALVPKGR